MFVSVQTLIEFIKNHFYVRSIKFLKSILDSNLYTINVEIKFMCIKISIILVIHFLKPLKLK